jgi:hypothetical protein
MHPNLRSVLAVLALAAPWPSLGAPAFIDATASRGIGFVQLYADPMPGYLPFETARYGTGAAASDFDRDGDLDLYLVNTYQNPSAFYRNDGDRFTDITDDLGLRFPGYGRTPLFADLDNDGFDDLIVLCDSNGRPEYPFSKLYRNNGDGTFSDVSEGSGFHPRAVVLGGGSAGDIDHDGDLDLFVVTWYNQLHYLYRNDGGFHFTDITATAVTLQVPFLQMWTPLFVDLDGDRWQDLFCAVDFDEDYVLLNDRSGNLRRMEQPGPLSFNNDMGVAVADFDDDGDIDLYTTNISNVEAPEGCCNWLYVNDGTGRLHNEAGERGVENTHWGWGTTFLDVELDGDLDLAAVSGWQQPEWVQPPSLLLNDGTGHFSHEETEAGLTRSANTRSLLPFDWDRDGDIDLLTIDWEGPAILWENQSAREGHYLVVELEGVESNRNGVGARIYVSAGARTRLVEVTCGGSFSAGPPLEAHFGLGDTDVVDVRVVWPSGRIQRRERVPVDQVLRLKEPPVDDEVVTPLSSVFAFPNPFRGSTSFRLADGEVAEAFIVDSRGARVRRLRPAGGTVVWDGHADDGRAVAPGVYYVDLGEGRAGRYRLPIVLVR